DTVLLSDVLKQGDSVVTSGLGGDFPRGLLLGKVDIARPSSDRLFQQVTLVPAITFSKLRTVFVIKGDL
ncbi:MAG: rod shape-determining protein MreC, partial [Candidatus Moranbacteria bacterium]|nr:rod shape-determining protein MreC [Candidatus Moranbacteria bacterium]